MNELKDQLHYVQLETKVKILEAKLQNEIHRIDSLEKLLINQLKKEDK